jgi:hypothetical protein
MEFYFFCYYNGGNIFLMNFHNFVSPMQFLDNLQSNTFKVNNGVSKQKMHMFLEATQSMLKVI